MGVGAQNQRLHPRGGRPSGPTRGQAQGTADSKSLSSPLGSGENRRGAGVFSPSPPSLSLPNQMPRGTSLLEGSGAPLPRGSGLGAPRGPGAGTGGGRGPRGGGTDPACCESRSRGSEAEAWAPRRGRVKNNSIKTSKTFGFIFGGGRCFKKKIREEPQNPEAKPNPNP